MQFLSDLPWIKLWAPPLVSYDSHLSHGYCLHFLKFTRSQIFLELIVSTQMYDMMLPLPIGINRFVKCRSSLSLVMPLALTIREAILRGKCDERSLWNHFDKSSWSQVSSAIYYYVLIHLCQKNFPQKRSINRTNLRWTRSSLATLPSRTTFGPLCYIRFNKHQHYYMSWKRMKCNEIITLLPNCFDIRGNFHFYEEIKV